MVAKLQNIIGTTKKTSENLKLHSKKTLGIGGRMVSTPLCMVGFRDCTYSEEYRFSIFIRMMPYHISPISCRQDIGVDSRGMVAP